jgi:hypothetical protein
MLNLIAHSAKGALLVYRAPFTFVINTSILLLFLLCLMGEIVITT